MLHFIQFSFEQSSNTYECYIFYIIGCAENTLTQIGRAVSDKLASKWGHIILLNLNIYEVCRSFTWKTNITVPKMASISGSEMHGSVVISVWICGRKTGNNIIHFTLLKGCRKQVSSVSGTQFEDKRKLNNLVRNRTLLLLNPK